MSVKITQKRGRRTDSVSLDLDALKSMELREYNINAHVKGDIMTMDVMVGDLALSFSASFQTMMEIMPVVAEVFMGVGAKLSGSELPEQLKAAKIMSNVIQAGTFRVNDEEDCSPCEEKGIEGLADYFKRLIKAYEGGSDVSDSVREHITDIRYFERNLRAEDAKVRKKAYDKAQEFLSKYP